jgi:hypothetical protein
LSGLSACSYDDCAEEYVETSETEFDWSGGKVVVVDNRRGDLEIEELPGSKLHLEAKKRIVAPSPHEEREIARGVIVEAIQSGDTLRLEVHYPDARLSDSRVLIVGRDTRRPRVRVDLVLQVPPGAVVRHRTRSGDARSERYTGSLDYSSLSGDVYLDDWRGDVQLMTRSGDASLGRVSGNVAMSTVSGEVTAQEIAGNLLFDATSGDLRVTRVGGSLEVSTASGDVEVQAVEGGLAIRTTSGDVNVGWSRARGQVETSSGDVALGLRAPEGRMQVRSATGDLELRIELPYAGRLEASTASGAMDVQAPLEVERAERNRLTGRFGPGRQVLGLVTASGDIVVHSSGGRMGS